MMSRYRVSLPPAMWPADLRTRFETSLGPLGKHKRQHLERAFGRWLKSADEEGLPPDQVSVDLWRRRVSALDRQGRSAVRQVLAAVFPEKRAELYAPPRRNMRNAREKLAALVARNLQRWPADWRDAAEPLFKIHPEGAEDGILVQAWSLETIQGRVEYVSAHFSFCRVKNLPLDISPETVRANLRDRQARCKAGELRVGGTAIYLGRLSDLAGAVRPERSWDWLRAARDRMKKIAQSYPSRNEGRVVDVVELRLAALKLMKAARWLHRRARTQKQRVSAHTLARTALGMLLLSETPIRVGSLAAIEIGLQLTPNFRTIRLSPHETKEGNSDQRCLSNDAVEMIEEYVRLYRADVAPAGEPRLFLGARGVPLSPDRLSQTIGNFCERTFGTRATAHCVRNAVADFIVSEAPEQAGLASTILKHRRAATTEVYAATANQVVAGQVLRRSVDSTAIEVGAVRAGRRPAAKPARARSLRAELAERKAGRKRDGL
jgi:hypothetical protein